MAKKTPRKHRKWLYLILALVVIAGIVGAVIVLTGKDEIAVQSGKVTQGELTQLVSASGRVNPATKVEISANVSAEIRQIHVREGDRVQRGQMLVSLDSRRYQANNQQAQAAVQAARAQARLAEARLELAKKTLKRTRELFDKKLASTEVLDAAETEVAVLEAGAQAARDSARQAAAGSKVTSDELAKATIVSPMDGVVTRLNKEEGEIALGSTFARDVIMEISDPARIIATVDVDEADIVDIELGDRATVEIDALPDVKFAGQVVEIAGSASVSLLGTQEETVSFEVEVLLEGDTSKTRPGMSATADIVTEVKTSVFQVPIQCVTMRDPEALKKAAEEGEPEAEDATPAEEAPEAKDTGAAVIGDITKMKELLFAIVDGAAQPLWVETGISSDTQMEVTGEGLAADQEIICGPFKTLNRELKPGDLVTVAPGASGAAK